jgi:hypothetical protein
MPANPTHLSAPRNEAVTILLRTVRELVGDAPAPLDRDALALLRVTEMVLSAAPAECLDPADMRAALALIAKRARATEYPGESSPEAGTLAAITEIGSRRSG